MHFISFFLCYFFLVNKDHGIVSDYCAYVLMFPLYVPINFCVDEILFFLSSVYVRRKVLDLRKFSTSRFRWIYMFWEVINTILPFLENVCMSVFMSLKFCGHYISRTNAWKLIKLYIQLHLDIIWWWLDFGE